MGQGTETSDEWRRLGDGYENRGIVIDEEEWEVGSARGVR